MGSPLQQILPGRGDQKGKGFWVKRAVPLFFLVFTWLGLLINFPETKTDLWFLLSAVSIVIVASLHFLSNRREFSTEFLFSIALIYAGFCMVADLPWLSHAYFPFIIIASALYSLKIVIPFSFLVPLIQLRSFFRKETLAGELAFSFFLVLTAVTSSLIFRRLRNEKREAVSDLEKIRNSAREIVQETEMGSLDSDEVLSHYFAAMLKTDEEIQELLLTIRQAVLADSANLFIPDDSSFSLRCTTGDKGDILITGKGIVHEGMRDKKPFFAGDLNEKETQVGYIKNMKISSLLAIPIVEGSVSIGLLTVDSSRYQAFSETDRNTVQMFAKQLIRILERERVYMMIKRDISGLKILREGSSNLVTSLDIDVVTTGLCGIAKKIVSSQVFFFLLDSGRFELTQHTGVFNGEKKQFHFRGTIANFAIVNKQRHYVSDTTAYRVPVMPFETKNVRSVIAIPMQYENELLGLLVMLSEKRDFLDTFQIGLLEVLCNQASISIANAKLHAEIEKLATTDGLTGLFNHRRFQEKLSDEFKRLNRYASPVSLILTDIDYFKKVNDTYGHPAGDLVLKGVSKIIREQIRDMDVPARYGGEEFAVILPGTEAEGAKNIAERLRTAVMDTTFSADGKSLKVTISIGIATAPVDAKNKEELIERTDKALYHAKHNGRNQSVIWRSMR
ncbi:MAG: sensor domain-containing diguanylate cyclase, partial [Nitrospirota bacterium]|nr:sensor domain-containing diguanylate cyclase [Nitrospirota bacterium]